MSTVQTCWCVNVTDTDELQAVFAGSALWLDCTLLVQPVDSLVQVSWYRDDELLYYQYLINDRTVSYPPNTTAGFMFHARASSQSVGHVILWPVVPQDAGVYRCHVVISSGDDDATDAKQQKTTTVFVCESVIMFVFACNQQISMQLPSVLWRFSLGIRKSIHSVKVDWRHAGMVIWSEMQLICIWFSWCHHHLTICCFIKILNDLPF